MFKLKKVVLLITTFVFLLLLPLAYTQSESTKEEEKGNGLTEVVREEEHSLESSPILKEGRVLVSVRNFFSIEGGKLEWNEEEKAVYGHNENGNELRITEETVKIDGKKQDLEVLPKNREGRMFVPLRHLANFFDYEITWNEEERIVNIKGKDFVIEEKVELLEKEEVGVIKEKVVEAKVKAETKTVSDREKDLLARIIYAEARGESLEGKIAVGATVINRKNSTQFPNSIEEVIFEPGQFCAAGNSTFNSSVTSKSIKAAEDALSGKDPSRGSLFFVNRKKSSATWFDTLSFTSRIGDHWFYKY